MKDYDKIVKAAWLIDKGYETYCCHALNNVGLSAYDFGEFFDKSHLQSWFEGPSTIETQKIRVLLLLLFAEATA